MDSRESQSRVGNGNRDRSAEIKASIDRTRLRMDETLDELGEKFHPRHLFWDAMDYLRSPASDGGNKVKEATSKAGHTIWRQVHQHPMPSMLIGAGIAWMFLEQQARQHPEYTQHAKRKVSDAISHIADSARQKVQGIKESIQDTAGEKIEQLKHASADRAERLTESAAEQGPRMLEQVRERATRAYHFGEDKFTGAAERYPLALGAGILAIGLLAGLAIPSTRTEDKLIGESADEVRDRARQAGEKVKQAVSAAASAAVEEAKAQGVTPKQAGEKTMLIAHQAMKAAKEESGVPTSHHPAS